MKKIIYSCSLILITVFYSCNKIKSGDELNVSDINYLKSLKLLHEGEKVYQFYSNFKFTISGSFFTDKRLANYWIDKKDKYKNVTVYAFYKDIVDIKPVYKVGLTYCPYLIVYNAYGSKFRVYADGNDKAIKHFFNEAIATWKKKRVERKTGFEPAAFSLGN